MSRPVLAIIALAAMFAPLADCSAQDSRHSFPREEARNRDRPDGPRRAVAADPFSSLERELISLQVDLKLRGDQAQAWNVFERDVRAAAAAEGERHRQIVELGEKKQPPATALSLLGELAEDGRKEAEAAARVESDLSVLTAKLDAAQRAMLDRRVIQSQTEPLGR